MWDRVFLRKLRQDLPGWIERGWVPREGGEAILDEVTARANMARFTPVAFATLGALALGTGVILFFAANWQEISRLLKLVVLFGAMWAAYGAGAYALSRPTATLHRLAHALLLLAVILFGANIMLIAQMYHMDRHYPNAILLWSLGALAVAFLARSQPAAVVAIAIGTLWSGTEIFEYNQVLHWPFLVLWSAFFALSVRAGWRFATGIAMTGLVVWSLMVVSNWHLQSSTWRGATTDVAEVSYLTGIFLLAYAALFVAAVVADNAKWLGTVAPIIERFAVFGVLLAFFGFGRRFVLGIDQYNFDRAQASGGWVAATVIATAVVVGLLARLRWARRDTAARRPEILGWALFVLTVAMLAVNLFIGAEDPLLVWLFLAVNLLYFVGIIWLIYAGYRRGDGFWVNLGFAFFALGLVTLYFDAFWTLAGRSYFFMGGGLLLLVGGYALERQRRRLLGGMAGADQDRGTP
jgi:uncharacterized membrane protein